MKKYITQILPKSKFNRNVVTLLIGTAISQIIPILASLIIARIYSPEDFGVLALYASVIAILGNIASFRYETAIVLPSKDSDGVHLTLLSLYILVFFTFLYTIVFVLFYDDFVKLAISKVGSSSWINFVILGFCIYASCQIINFWTNRKSRYKDLAKSRVIQSSTTATSNILLGLFGFTSFGLVISNILGQLFSTLFLFKKVKSEDFVLFKVISKKKLKKLASTYDQFPKFATPGTLFNTFATMGLPILITMFYDAKTAGLYFFAMKMVRLPLDLMFSSFAQVYREQAAKYYHTNKKYLLVFTKKIQLRLIFIMIPTLLALSVIAPVLFDLVFGQQWKEAGEYVKYFAVYIFLSGLYAPISSISDVLMQQKAVFLFNVLLVVLQIGVISFLQDKTSFSFMILFLSLACGLLFLLLDQYMKFVLMNKIKQEVL